jgi:hypothetical protein
MAIDGPRIAARVPRLLTLAAVAALLGPAPARAQIFDVEASLHRASTSISVLESPFGFRLGFTGHDLLGPLGLQLSFDRVSRGSVDENGYCGAFDCVIGPLDQSATLSTLRIAVRLASAVDRPVQLGVAVSGIFSSFRESLERSGSGEAVAGSSAGSLGFGVSGDVRFPPVVAGLRPFVYGQVERLGSESCDLDVSCFFGEARTVKAVGVGVAWRTR